MSNKEADAFVKKLDEGLALAEQVMQQEYSLASWDN